MWCELASVMSAVALRLDSGCDHGVCCHDVRVICVFWHNLWFCNMREIWNFHTRVQFQFHSRVPVHVKLYDHTRVQFQFHSRVPVHVKLYDCASKIYRGLEPVTYSNGRNIWMCKKMLTQVCVRELLFSREKNPIIKNPVTCSNGRDTCMCNKPNNKICTPVCVKKRSIN